MGEIAFIVSGIEQSEESRIYQFRAATPAEVTATDREGLAVPGRFRFEQIVNPEWDLGDANQYVVGGIAIDPYGCVTIPNDKITELVQSDAHGWLTIIVSKPEEDLPFLTMILLEDYTPLDDDQTIIALKVGDMVIFTNDE